MRRSLLLVACLFSASFGSAQPDTTPARSPEETARRARPFATIGERVVSVGDIEDAVAAQTPFQRAIYRTEPTRLRELAQRLVELEVLAEGARRRGLSNSPRVREIVDGHLVQVFVHDVVDVQTPPESVPDADVAAYYEHHPDEFSRPAMVRAHHVLLGDEASARALLASCSTMDLGAFRQRARDASLDDETKQAGGDLRYFTADGRPMGHEGRPVLREIVEAAFAIREVGECAPEPVRVGERFSVVKLSGRRDAEVVPLGAASESIRRRLWRERRDAALDRIVDTARARVRVTRRDELVRLVEIPPPDAEEAMHQHGVEADPPAPSAPPQR